MAQLRPHLPDVCPARDLRQVPNGTRVTIADERRIVAVCRTALWRFADDLELRLRPDEGIVAVRSASRLGWSDLGVNRRRVERLRAALRSRGVVE